MNWFELSPYFRLTIFTIILVVAVFSPAQLKKASDDITKQNAVRHLDGYSLSVLSNMTGLMFGGGNFGPSEMDALRHLMSLELIELDAVPRKSVIIFGKLLKAFNGSNNKSRRNFEGMVGFTKCPKTRRIPTRRSTG